MTMRFSRLVPLVLLAALTSCQTNVAVFDQSYGYEREVGGRAARVHAARAQIGPGRTPDATDIVVVVPGGDGRIDVPGIGYQQFVVRLKLHNESEQAWEFGTDNLRFAFTDFESGVCTDCPPARAKKLRTVPAREVVEVDVPVTIALPKDVRMHDAERYWLDMRVIAGDTKAELTSRRMILASYNQTWQVLRFGGVLTLVLLVGAL